MNSSIKTIVGFALLLLLFFFTSCKSAEKQSWHYLSNTADADEIRTTESKLEKMRKLFSGHVSNKAQADTSNNPMYSYQEIIFVPFWQKRKNEYWIYWAWIAGDQPELLLSEGIMQLSRHNRDSILAQHYNPPTELKGKLQFEWAKEEPFAKYSPKDLEELPCKSYIYELEGKRDEFAFTADEPCFAFDFNPLGEIQGMKIVFRFTPETIYDLSEHFDAQGELLFAYPEPIGVRYERLPKDAPKYKDILGEN